MKHQALNPYLPPHVYIPDGEPHVFGDRLYVFGSHDREGGVRYCELNYEVWSAPVCDLGDWTCHGVSYDKRRDPDYDPEGKYRDLYAPDVVQGNDERFYLYYAMAGGCFTGRIHVAVSDRPEGPYAWHGCVRNPDGTPYDRNITFDPGLINDDGVIRLYYGWAIAAPQMRGMDAAKLAQMRPMMTMLEQQMFEKTPEQIAAEPESIQGAFTVTLADDMLTVTSEPVRVAPGMIDAGGTSFENHAFFEASSIRKIGDTYYFIYSSEVNHELCYATSKLPDRDFVYRGVLISNGDIGYHGRAEQDRLAVTGNNHGSIVQVNNQWYIFYHRHTHLTPYSRQGCAEAIRILPDESIPQVEMTSCGLIGGPLRTEGIYPAIIACNLTNGHMGHLGGQEPLSGMPFITHQGEERFITAVTEGTRIGYKYFAFEGMTCLTLCARSTEGGSFSICLEDRKLGEIPVSADSSWENNTLTFDYTGHAGLYLTWHGSGTAELKSLSFD